MLNSDALKEKLSQLVNTQKLKEFPKSNAGIVSIAIIGVFVLVGWHFIRKHSYEERADASLSAWSTPMASSVSSNPSSTNAARTVSDKSNNSLTGNQAMPDNQSLQAQMKVLKQEMTALENQVYQLTILSLKKPYKLLGVRFDVNSNQWVADIKSENTLYSLKSGQTFEGWHVVSVDKEGADIE